MPKLTRNQKYVRRFMVLLRCNLALFYLWLMLEAAAIVPVVETQTKSSLFNKTPWYVLACSSLLPFDLYIQLYVSIIIFLVMLRLYQCCRSNLWYTRTHELIIGNMKRISFSRRLFLYFGPYMLLFLFCWIGSLYLLCMNVLHICLYETNELPISIYLMLAFAILFKLLVLTNGLIRMLRVYMVLRLLNQEVEYLINPHDFGEHLNLFFQY